MEMIIYDSILFILKYTIRILNVSSDFMFQNRVVVNLCKLTVGGETMLNNLWMTWPVMGLSRGGCVTSLPSGGCHSPVIVWKKKEFIVKTPTCIFEANMFFMHYSEVHMVKTFYLVFREVSLVQQGLSLLLQDLLRGGLRGLRGRDLLIQRLPWYKQGLPIPHQLSWNQAVKWRKKSSVMH